MMVFEISISEIIVRIESLVPDSIIIEILNV